MRRQEPMCGSPAPGRAALVLLAAAALAVLAPAPAAAQSTNCRGLQHTRFIRVSGTRQLQAAIGASRAGDLIEMQDGLYSQFQVAGKRGSGGKQEESITICGSPRAVVSGTVKPGANFMGYSVHLLNCAYVRVMGITVINGQKGVVLEGTVYSVLANMVVRTVASAAIHLKHGSSGNLVYLNRILDTGHLIQNGRRYGGTGEGVYIGSAIESGFVDHSDYNRVISNVIGPGVTAEMVDIKEFTSRGQVAGNYMIGSGLMGQNSAVSCINAKGNAYLIQSNQCIQPLADGFATHTKAPGWGAFNVFKANKCSSLRPGNACVALGSSAYPGAPRSQMGNKVFN